MPTIRPGQLHGSSRFGQRDWTDADQARMPHVDIRHILACIDGTDNDRAVLDHALQVALRFDGHIDGLHVRFDTEGADAGRWQADRILGPPVEAMGAEAAARARRHFDDWQTQSKLPLRESGTATHGASTWWREIVGHESDVVARLGRLSDLIVIARPNELATSSTVMALETAVFDTARPVLMVPPGASGDLFHRAVIAWNGSCEAARAVGFALPFLAQCEHAVDIFTARESKHHIDIDELQRYLGWHEIVGEPVAADLPHDPDASLLTQANARHASLIVMGAYTHGHYRQFVFGGVTRHMMQHANLPVLLAH